MAEIMRGLLGKAIISINDHPDIGTAFAGFHMETIGMCNLYHVSPKNDFEVCLRKQGRQVSLIDYEMRTVGPR